MGHDKLPRALALLESPLQAAFIVLVKRASEFVRSFFGPLSLSHPVPPPSVKAIAMTPSQQTNSTPRRRHFQRHLDAAAAAAPHCRGFGECVPLCGIEVVVFVIAANRGSRKPAPAPRTQQASGREGRKEGRKEVGRPNMIYCVNSVRGPRELGRWEHCSVGGSKVPKRGGMGRAEEAALRENATLLL